MTLDEQAAPPEPTTSRELFRHTLATLAYRAGKALRDAPPGFGAFQIGDTTRTPSRILAHMGDLMEWGLAMAGGEHRWRDSEPLPWDDEVARFFSAVSGFDEYLASSEPLRWKLERLFSGPVADALTHVGQITQLRRLAGAPVRGENYEKADIQAGRVGPEQSPPRFEFD